MSDATYDMKKKLLDIKSELLKSSSSSQAVVEYCKEFNESQQSSGVNEIVCLLKEISSDQHKIIELLAEINNKMM